MRLGDILEEAKNAEPTVPERCGYISPAEAEQAIRILRAVEDLLGKDASRLAACLGFARDAVWTAAFPDDPAGLLSVIASQAEIAMG